MESLEQSLLQKYSSLEQLLKTYKSVAVAFSGGLDSAESYLRDLGFRQFRVRHHGKIARLELDAGEFPRLTDDTVRLKIRDKLREIGFTWATVDLAAFKSESMNILLGEGENE